MLLCSAAVNLSCLLPRQSSIWQCIIVGRTTPSLPIRPACHKLSSFFIRCIQHCRKLCIYYRLDCYCRASSKWIRLEYGPSHEVFGQSSKPQLRHGFRPECLSLHFSGEGITHVFLKPFRPIYVGRTTKPLNELS
jgi:hypothetical protein